MKLDSHLLPTLLLSVRPLSLSPSLDSFACNTPHFPAISILQVASSDGTNTLIINARVYLQQVLANRLRRYNA
jgi:hypothetical protein